MFWLYVIGYVVAGFLVVFRLGKAQRVATRSFQGDDNADLWIGIVLVFGIAIWPLLLLVGLVRLVGMIAQHSAETHDGGSDAQGGTQR